MSDASVFVGDAVHDWDGQERIEVRIGGIPAQFVHHLSLAQAESLMAQLGQVLLDRSYRMAEDGMRLDGAEAAIEQQLQRAERWQEPPF